MRLFRHGRLDPSLELLLRRLLRSANLLGQECNISLESLRAPQPWLNETCEERLLSIILLVAAEEGVDQLLPCLFKGEV